MVKRFKKLTPEDKQRIKENFLKNNRFGKILDKERQHIKDILSIATLSGFTILALGSFIPITWSITIPIINQYPLSFIFGTSVHGYTTYPSSAPNIIVFIAKSYVDTHHLTDIICMWAGYFIMVLITKSFIWAGLFSGFVIAIHEWFWWIGYDVYFYDFIFKQGHLNQSYISKLSIPYDIIIFAYIILKGYDWNPTKSEIKSWYQNFSERTDTRYLILMALMYFVWIWIIGFPITWGFFGPSQYIYNVSVILIEMASWIYAYITFITTVDLKIKYRWV